MRSVAVTLLFSYLSLAADPPPTKPAPPEMERALMARATAFNKLLVAEKYRAAEEFVLPESRDTYYTSEKPHILDFEVRKIDWEPNFQVATIEMASTVEMRRATIGAFQAKTAYYSHWKLDKGKWWYYYPQVTERLTPFGVMKVNPTLARESGLNVTQEIAKGRAEMESARTKSFAADRSGVTLPSKDSSETVVLSNLLPGPIRLDFRRTSGAGFDAALNAIEVAPKATADLKIYRSPGNRADFKPGLILVRAFPTGQTMTITVN